MNKSRFLAILLLLPALTPGLGQMPAPIRWNRVVAQSSPASEGSLSKFDLNFPGGPPAALVASVEKQTGKPLNVIIPDAGANVMLPPLAMTHVDVAQLFSALSLASQSVVRVNNGPFSSTQEVYYGFATDAPNNSPTDDSIWYFHFQPVVESNPPKRVCRFDSLEPYLDRGYTVDDISTVIRTGWEMLPKGNDDVPAPQLSFHKETRLLIIVGTEEQLGVVNDALGSLPATTASRNEIDDMKHQITDLKARVDALTKAPWAAGKLANPNFLK